MRQILLLLIFTSLQINASANCAMGGIYAFPANSSLSQHSMIVLEGYMMSQEIIKGLNKKYPVYLQSGKHQVSLEVLEICQGAKSLAQAILRPTEELRLGENYQLKIDRLAKEEERWLLQWDATHQKREAISWTITEAAIAKPSWRQMPKLVETKTHWYGCGPAMNATFDFAVADRLTTLVETELVDLETQETQCYYLRVDKGELLNVGHGMCSGAFSYQENHRYQVRFKLTNLLGEKDREWTDWIAFDSPYEALALNRN